jgi:hypothetical protein
MRSSRTCRRSGLRRPANSGTPTKPWKSLGRPLGHGTAVPPWVSRELITFPAHALLIVRGAASGAGGRGRADAGGDGARRAGAADPSGSRSITSGRGRVRIPWPTRCAEGPGSPGIGLPASPGGLRSRWPGATGPGSRCRTAYRSAPPPRLLGSRIDCGTHGQGPSYYRRSG